MYIIALNDYWLNSNFIYSPSAKNHQFGRFLWRVVLQCHKFLILLVQQILFESAKYLGRFLISQLLFKTLGMLGKISFKWNKLALICYEIWIERYNSNTLITKKFSIKVNEKGLLRWNLPVGQTIQTFNSNRVEILKAAGLNFFHVFKHWQKWIFKMFLLKELITKVFIHFQKTIT